MRENMAPKSPPISRPVFSEAEPPTGLVGDFACFDFTGAPPVCSVKTGGRSGTAGSSLGGGTECFFCPPKDHVRGALNKDEVTDLVDGPRSGPFWASLAVALLAFRVSTGELPFAKSADDGAVEALLCLEE